MVSAIIVAAGSGKRMGQPIPKQFITINGKTILEHSIDKFITSNLFDELIIVLSADHIDAMDDFQKPKKTIIKTCLGGKERFHSVQNALQKIAPNCKQVFIHDAVRPFCSHNLLHRCLQQAKEFDCAIPAIPIKDSIRRINEAGKSEYVNRTNLRSIQTPQVFDYSKLFQAYQTDYLPEFTDDTTVYERAGHPVHLVEGEPSNIKITTPEDLEFAKVLLA